MISRRNVVRLGMAGLVGIGAAMAGRAAFQLAQLGRARALYYTPVTAPDGPLSVYHLGHSLVGRDMPAMLAQLAPAGHNFASQLGWGTPLRAHWEPEVEINGFDAENNHPNFAPAREALTGGTFNAVVMTEMVELMDAIKYHDSATYLANWAGLARDARPDVRLYLYETWHNTDDPAGWESRIAEDFEALWLNRVALPAASTIGAPIYIIPGGQVMGAVAQALEAAGRVGNLDGRDALMARTPEGAVDTIHLNDMGNYLIALTHYATIYQRDPHGLRFALRRADGSAADAPDAQAAAFMQQIVWDTVQRTRPLNGVAI